MRHSEDIVGSPGESMAARKGYPGKFQDYEVYENGDWAGIIEGTDPEAVMARVLAGLREWTSHSYEEGDRVAVEVRRDKDDAYPIQESIVIIRNGKL